MTIPDGVLAAIFITAIMFSVWMCIIMTEHLEYKRNKPKPPPMVEYDGPEPIGFYLNHKDWDDTQWEAPPWNKRPTYLLQFDNILTTNEIRTMNLEKMMLEASLGQQAILSPKGMDVKVLRNGYWEHAYLKDLKGEMQTCQRCLERLTHNHTLSTIKLTEPQIGTIKH